MARPTKPGLDYFPLDCTVFTSRPFSSVGAEFGTKGVAISIAVLCAIYREGYFVKWDDDMAISVSRDLWLGNSAKLINDVVGKLVRIGYFDELTYKQHQILTSREIQRTYFAATSKRKRPAYLPYLLVSDTETPVSGEETPISVTINPLKVKKIKENKSKRERVSDSHELVAPSPIEIGDYFKELGYRGDPDRFVDFYAARGWTIGGVPMVDWRAAARLWTRNDDRQKPKMDLTRPCDDISHLTDEDYAKGWD